MTEDESRQIQGRRSFRGVCGWWPSAETEPGCVRGAGSGGENLLGLSARGGGLVPHTQVQEVRSELEGQ